MAKTQEIEQRWLVRDFDAEVFAGKNGRRIVQGYLPSEQGCSLRVRIEDGSRAVLGLKHGFGEVRDQEEEGVSMPAAELLLRACYGRLGKRRREVDGWELDVFERPFDNLKLLERERKPGEDRQVPPEWVGESVEVTDILNSEFLVRLAGRLDKPLSAEGLEGRSREADLRDRLTFCIIGGSWADRARICGHLQSDLAKRLVCVPDVASEIISDVPANRVRDELLIETKRVWDRPKNRVPMALFADDLSRCFGRLGESTFSLKRARSRRIIALDLQAFERMQDEWHGMLTDDKTELVEELNVADPVWGESGLCELFVRHFNIHLLPKPLTSDLHDWAVAGLVRDFLG